MVFDGMVSGGEVVGVGRNYAGLDTVGTLQIKKHLGSGCWMDFITDFLRIRFDEIRAFP
jgi:hypothetical protein